MHVSYRWPSESIRGITCLQSQVKCRRYCVIPCSSSLSTIILLDTVVQTGIIALMDTLPYSVLHTAYIESRNTKVRKAVNRLIPQTRRHSFTQQHSRSSALYEVKESATYQRKSHPSPNAHRKYTQRQSNSRQQEILPLREASRLSTYYMFLRP